MTALHPRFPARLRAIDKPPVELWLWGQAPVVTESGVVFTAIVGSRAASGAGCRMARTLAAELARAGITIVSGGAFGIDAAAHEGAIEGGGKTLAVLGCGIDVAYPDRHAGLFARIRSSGCLVSEYGPGTPPLHYHFPIRNRIVVGLAEVVIVVEAAPRSGALITARLARKAGRPVCALRGSPGTDELISDGHAIAVRDVDDVRAVLAGQSPRAACEPPAGGAGPVAELLAALDALAPAAVTVDQLAARLHRPAREVMATLTGAEMDGQVFRSGLSAWKVKRG